jgi:hypothetical protein
VGVVGALSGLIGWQHLEYGYFGDKGDSQCKAGPKGASYGSARSFDGYMPALVSTCMTPRNVRLSLEVASQEVGEAAREWLMPLVRLRNTIDSVAFAAISAAGRKHFGARPFRDPQNVAAQPTVARRSPSRQSYR